MSLKTSLVLLCCLAAVVIVQSETTIEVDENGDEYEVKRFNIQGRQLDGGNSQCVITRRKRSTADSAKENVDNGGTEMKNAVESKSKNDNIQDGNENFNGVGRMENSNYDDGEYDDYEYDEMDDNVQVPIIIQKQIISPYVSQQVAAESLNANGLYVVQAKEPPKVNPETHAVFQLLPVNHAIHAVAGDEIGNGELHFEEEISPASTTAIWSTGDDDNVNRYHDELEDDDYEDEMEENVDMKPSKPNSKPSKKPNKEPTKRPSKKNSKIKNNKRRPMKKDSVKINRNNKNKNRFNRRQGYNRRKNVNNNRFKYSNKPNRFNNVRRKVNKKVSQKGDDWFTKTETVTHTGTADDDKDLNCIIIRKDKPATTTTTTTARPFWNFLGRNADINTRQFGNRKRVNLRLVAKEKQMRDQLN